MDRRGGPLPPSGAAGHTPRRATLRLSLDVTLSDRSRRAPRESADVVHAAMGELEARRLTALGYEVAIDRPYQHYQFAGNADVMA